METLQASISGRMQENTEAHSHSGTANVLKAKRAAAVNNNRDDVIETVASTGSRCAELHPGVMGISRDRCQMAALLTAQAQRDGS